MSATYNRFKPMNQFDPKRPALIREQITGRTFTWSGTDSANYEKNATLREDGLVELDGLVLDGWTSIDEGPGRLRNTSFV